jgi:hypothetical protein
VWEFIQEITQVTSQILTMIVAAIGVWVAYMTLLRTPEQPSDIHDVSSTKSKIVNEFEKSKNLIVFQTSDQRTELRATDKGIECHLFDARQEKIGGLQWVISKGEVENIKNNKDFHVTSGFKPRSGNFSIGPRHNWLYSKSLFPEPILLKNQLGKLVDFASS